MVKLAEATPLSWNPDLKALALTVAEWFRLKGFT
jgi:hypothetical protein